MSKADCPQNKPYVVDLEPGTYWWCSCGKSNSQPFCDGSHKDTDFAPVPIKVAQKTKMGLCGCKRTGKAPICDGSHKDLD